MPAERSLAFPARFASCRRVIFQLLFENRKVFLVWNVLKAPSLLWRFFFRFFNKESGFAQSFCYTRGSARLRRPTVK